jgi:hypothetical protein
MGQRPSAGTAGRRSTFKKIRVHQARKAARHRHHPLPGRGCRHALLLRRNSLPIQAADCLGYCPLRNTYLQWQQLSEGRFLLLVSNGESASHFYFSSPAFWDEQRTALARTAVLLNFHQDFEVLEELGEGSFARVYRVRETKTGEEYAAKMVSKSDATPACVAMLAE